MKQIKTGLNIIDVKTSHSFVFTSEDLQQVTTQMSNLQMLHEDEEDDDYESDTDEDYENVDFDDDQTSD